MGLPISLKPAEELIADENLALRHWLLGATHFVTHSSADLDGLLSLVFAQLFRKENGLDTLPVGFVLGSEREFPPGTVALDIGPSRGLHQSHKGGMMIKSSWGPGACCMAIMRILSAESQNALGPLVAEISRADESSRHRNSIEWALSEIHDAVAKIRPRDKELLTKLGLTTRRVFKSLYATSIYDQFRSLKRICDDQELYKIVKSWVKGALRREEEKSGSLHLVENSTAVETYFSGRLAVLPIGSGASDSRKAEREGAEFTIYCRSPSRDPRKWMLVLHKTAKVPLKLSTLFLDRMDDFEGIGIEEQMVGWTGKGILWLGTPSDIHHIRQRFIERVVTILEPWILSRHHQ